MMGPGDFDGPVKPTPPVEPGATPQDPAGPIEERMEDPETAAWMGLSYATLSALMVHARYVAVVHQHHHWVSRGDSFYGDHLLFERLYSSVAEEIDGIAEKLVGLASEKNLDLSIQMKMLAALVEERYGMHAMIPTSGTLAAKSLDVEEAFVVAIVAAMDALEDQGELTVGLENFLAQLADDHEKNKYLLKQRISA
jgi:DNA-binding ferritin-like protein